ncbi:MAG: hypothetical protein ACE5G1_10925 [bacterium]
MVRKGKNAKDELPHVRLEQGGREKEALRRIADQSFAEMGIHCPPIPPEELQKMMLESGIRPEENLFSRGIIDQRYTKGKGKW